MGERRSTKVMQPNKMWVAWLAPAFESYWVQSTWFGLVENFMEVLVTGSLSSLVLFIQLKLGSQWVFTWGRSSPGDRSLTKNSLFRAAKPVQLVLELWPLCQGLHNTHNDSAHLVQTKPCQPLWGIRWLMGRSTMVSKFKGAEKAWVLKQDAQGKPARELKWRHNLPALTTSPKNP
jgi:hypothetical protein